MIESLILWLLIFGTFLTIVGMIVFAIVFTLLVIFYLYVLYRFMKEA